MQIGVVCCVLPTCHVVSRHSRCVNLSVKKPAQAAAPISLNGLYICTPYGVCIMRTLKRDVRNMSNAIFDLRCVVARREPSSPTDATASVRLSAVAGLYLSDLPLCLCANSALGCDNYAPPSAGPSSLFSSALHVRVKSKTVVETGFWVRPLKFAMRCHSHSRLR